jgi:hypothetical protein
MEVTPALLKADLCALADVRKPDTTCQTLASWVVEDGRPGAKPA